MQTRPTVAISEDFFTAYSNIPRKQQHKVQDFLFRFRECPDSGGINYEKIHDARDDNLRSVRIDDTYRGIVMKPKRGNVYLLLWVDHHDDAYAWARRRTCRVNPETGSLQIFQVEEREERKERDAPGTLPGLFDNVREKHLLQMGVPQEKLEALRQVRTEEDLEDFAATLPPEAAEALAFLQMGCTVEEVLTHLEIEEIAREIDTEDYARALETSLARSRFMVVEDDLEFQAILQAPLERWRVFLHPSQRKLVERSWNGPVRVLGGAGTGKTVVALHRAKWLAEHALKSSHEKVLFTTFTVNLAEDIRDNLARICKDEIFRRIEVMNLDQWASNFLRKRGYTMTPLGDWKKREEFWEKALCEAPEDLPLTKSFYQEEWERVILPEEVTTLQEYFRADRTGRGVGLNRKQRKAVWRVFEEFRRLMEQEGYSEFPEILRHARQVLEVSQEPLPYRAMVVDEAQDLGPLAFRLIRRMVPPGENDLFIVGDGHQRIYSRKVVLSRTGVEVRGRSRKLRVNYRTTQETMEWGNRLLENRRVDDLDGGEDALRGCRSLLRGLEPRLEGFETFEKEAAFLGDYLRELSENGESLKDCCVVVRTNSLLKKFQEALEARELSTVLLDPRSPENRRDEGVRLGTMHRVKGLEFERMFVAGVGAKYLPLHHLVASEDATVREEGELQERSLLYVAATRARNHLVITWHGEPSPFLERELPPSAPHVPPRPECPESAP